MKLLSRYRMQGEVDLAVHYAGPMEGKGPALSVGAKVMKGRMKEKQSGVAFTDIFGELALELTPKGTPSKLLVKGFAARTGSGTIRGDWQSTGLTNAMVKADLQVDIALADLLRFAQVDTLGTGGGHLSRCYAWTASCATWPTSGRATCGPCGSMAPPRCAMPP